MSAIEEEARLGTGLARLMHGGRCDATLPGDALKASSFPASFLFVQ